MDQENGPVLSSAFPPPPPYYKSFTSENLQLLKSGNVTDSLDKKRELQYLVPPPAPVEGSYTTFGDVWRVRTPIQFEQRIDFSFLNVSRH
jgi:mediator of RNA polymerase II transcription subunit 7